MARSVMEHVLDQMQNVIDRARIRDAGRIRAHKLALAVALIADDVLADPKVDDEHRAVVREILGECRALAVGARAGMQPELLVEGIPRDDVLATIRAEVEREIAEQAEYLPGTVLA